MDHAKGSKHVPLTQEILETIVGESSQVNYIAIKLDASVNFTFLSVDLSSLTFKQWVQSMFWKRCRYVPNASLAVVVLKNDVALHH